MAEIGTQYQNHADIAKQKAEQKMWEHILDYDRYIRHVFPNVQETSKSVYHAFRDGDGDRTRATITAITGTTAYTASHFIEGMNARSHITVQDSKYNGRISDVLLPGNREETRTDCSLVSLASRQRLRPIAKLADSFDENEVAFMIGYPQILPIRSDYRQVVLFAQLVESIDVKGLISIGVTNDTAARRPDL